MNEYSDKVIMHFQNPKNAGIIENADGIGEIGDPDCGDFMKVYIKVENDIITDIKYQIKGCPASIACASAMTEIAIGLKIEDAMVLREEAIVEALEWLPEYKLHCSNLSAGALRIAINDRFEKFYKIKRFI